MGARIGWIISGAIVLLAIIGVIAWAMFYTGMLDNIGEPTAATAPEKLEMIHVDIDITKLATPGTGSGAEKIYGEAVDLASKSFTDSRDFCDYVRHNTAPEADPKLQPILEKLLAAADKGLDSNVQLNFESLPVRADRNFMTQETLYCISKVATKASLSARADGKKDEAIKAAQAALIFGDRLWRQGFYRPYRYAGMGATGDALAEFQADYDKFGDKDKAELAKQLADARKEGLAAWQEKERIVRTLKPKAGDLGRLATLDKDPTWRVEGVIWLGLAQYTSAREGQRTAIRAFLAKMEGNSDPVLAAAAKEAAAVTKADLAGIASP